MTSVLTGGKGNASDAANHGNQFAGYAAGMLDRQQAQYTRANDLANLQAGTTEPIRAGYMAGQELNAGTGQLPYQLQVSPTFDFGQAGQGTNAPTQAGYQGAMQNLVTRGQLMPGSANEGPGYQGAQLYQGTQAGNVQYNAPNFNQYNTATREGTENAYTQARQQVLEGSDARGGQLSQGLTQTSLARGSQLAENAQNLAALQNQYGQQNAQFGANVGLQNAARFQQGSLANAGMLNQYGVSQAQLQAQYGQEIANRNQAAAMGQYGQMAQQYGTDIGAQNQFSLANTQNAQTQANAFNYGQLNPAQRELYNQRGQMATNQYQQQINTALGVANSMNPAGVGGVGASYFGQSNQAMANKYQALSSGAGIAVMGAMAA